jgi:hypothetical protein
MSGDGGTNREVRAFMSEIGALMAHRMESHVSDFVSEYQEICICQLRDY